MPLESVYRVFQFSFAVYLPKLLDISSLGLRGLFCFGFLQQLGRPQMFVGCQLQFLCGHGSTLPLWQWQKNGNLLFFYFEITEAIVMPIFSGMSQKFIINRDFKITPPDFSGKSGVYLNQYNCCEFIVTVKPNGVMPPNEPIHDSLSLHINNVLENVMCPSDFQNPFVSVFLPDIRVGVSASSPEQTLAAADHSPSSDLHTCSEEQIHSAAVNSDFTQYIFCLNFISKLVFKIDILNLHDYINLPLYGLGISTAHSF